jgi:histidyl-tRNA synthetase
VQMHAAGAEGMGSMKSQFKKADGSGARYALIFGTDELAQGKVSIKPLRGDRGAEPAPQQSRPLADAAAWASELLEA